MAAGACCAVVSHVRIGAGAFALSRSSSYHCRFSSVCVLPCVLWVGKCGGVWTVLRSVLLPCLYVCCHSIVDLGWCLCGRVVSLWGNGDGLRGAERRGVRWWVCFNSLLCLSLFLCVGVRGSARAALRARTLSPNTIASLLLLVCSLLSCPRLSSPSVFLLLNGGGVFTMCWSVVLA